jgi:CRISPR-associated endonuclease/helicase Cas3
MDFAEFFRRATNWEAPFHYQIDLATGTVLPDLIRVPTGAGKTAAVVLAWLWRRRFNDATKTSTPRRLVYCLPMRALVEQTRVEAEKWLKNLKKAFPKVINRDDGVGVQVLMGGEEGADWDLHPEGDAILIGTQDMLLSRALNRGYGMSRYRWPMHYALLNNDCLWVLDEIQLMGSGLSTTTQLEAFRREFRVVGHARSIWMSATLQEEWLRSVDFRRVIPRPSCLMLGDEDKNSERFKPRYDARKPIERAPLPIGSGAEAIARLVRQHHKEGKRTLVVVNTVERAKELFAQIAALEPGKPKKGRRDKPDATPPEQLSDPEPVLIHSRFRPRERRQKMERLLAPLRGKGQIVVATQVIEAGVDISSTTLFTDLAPWASLVQRFGRCNRLGNDDEAQVYWIDLDTADKKQILPYEDRDLESAREALTGDGMADVGPRSIDDYLDGLDDRQRESLFPFTPAHVVRRKDVVDLFDTTPDLAGNDIDVARFIRDGEDLDVQVYWRDFDPARKLEETRPRREELCPVPFARFRDDFLKAKGKSAYRWDALGKGWLRADEAAVFPGQVFLVPSRVGGYNPNSGWDAKSPHFVDPVEKSEDLEALPDDAGVNEAPEALDDDNDSHSPWQSIADHTEEVLAEAVAILDRLRLEPVLRQVIEIAVRWHDRGKGHSVFQEAIREELADGTQRPGDWQGRTDIAKAPKRCPGNFWRRYRNPHFRHELASGLAMLLSESCPDLDGLRRDGLLDLATYIATAHHGKVRLSIRSLPGEKRPEKPVRLFARGVWGGDQLTAVALGRGVTAPDVTLNMDVMQLGRIGGQLSWAERMLALRQEYGPFRLAFLEAILCAADRRASAAHARRSGEADA